MQQQQRHQYARCDSAEMETVHALVAMFGQCAGTSEAYKDAKKGLSPEGHSQLQHILNQQVQNRQQQEMQIQM